MTNVAELPFFVHIGAGKVGFGVAVAAWGAGQIVGGRVASCPWNHGMLSAFEKDGSTKGGAFHAGNP